MEVFLVPVGPARFELYSEQVDTSFGGDPSAPQTGLIARARRGFAEMLLAAADRERAKREGRWQEPSSWFARLRDRATAWVAERVAEQQLHWSLRQVEAVVLVHPDDLAEESAVATVRNALAHDRRWHGRWAAAHAAFFAASGVLAVLPGPNVVAYYFAFRMVGHWLSRRGAVQGLTRVRWTTRSSRALTELADTLLLHPDERHPRVADIAERLDLKNLPTFVERVRLRRA